MGLITTKDHIKNVVDSINKTIVVNSVVADGSNWKLMTTNTKWATFGKMLSGKVIKAVVFNESITIASATEPTIGIYNLTAPFFYYGTFLETNSELIKVSSSNNKLPLIYLHMNAPERFEDEESTIDFESDCAIYFLVDADPKNWLRSTHLEQAIKPMKSLCSEFIRSLFAYGRTNASNKITYVENDYANFGKVQWEGVKTQIFADNTSGTELLIKIPFNKCFSCCEN